MSTGEKRLEVGEVVECRYHIVSEGAPQDLGTLYRGHDIRHDRPVLILVLLRRFGTGFEALKRIAQANQIVTELQLPGLVPLDYVGLVDGQPYLVHSAAKGHSLAELLRQVGALGPDVALEIAVRLCDALAPLHRAGLVHGGLSAHSVWLGIREGHEGEGLGLGSGLRLEPGIAVMHSGLVPALQTFFATPGQPWGRFPYLSPEQAAGDTVLPASDVYVIGSLLYEMLTGRPPFRASDEMVLVLQHLRQDPPSLQILAPQVPPVVSQIVQKALAKEPAARYRNAGQLSYVLRAQLEQLKARSAELSARPDPRRLVVPPPPPPSPAPAAPPRIRRYELIEDAEDRPEETEAVDWFFVALVIVAIIAVLGLIPLWQTVYHRYAVPTPLSAPVSYYGVEYALSRFSATTSRGLDDFGLVWYNLLMPMGLKAQGNRL